MTCCFTSTERIFFPINCIGKRNSGVDKNSFRLCNAVFSITFPTFAVITHGGRTSTKKYSTMKTPIQTDQAPAAIGPYSQAIEAGGMVFVSGQLPIDPKTGEFAEGDIQALTHQSLTNMKHVLEAAGLTMANVVKTTVFRADLSDFAAMNEVYATYFSAPFPARSAVAVKTLPKNARVEIECIAVR